MADNNTLNFDLDAPAVPTLTLDPTPEAAAEEKKPEPAPAVQQPEVQLTPEEQAMVDSFAEKIDITNSQQVLQYGSACQKKIGDFSEAALAKVSTKDLGEVGDMITNLIGELKNFDANDSLLACPGCGSGVGCGCSGDFSGVSSVFSSGGCSGCCSCSDLPPPELSSCESGAAASVPPSPSPKLSRLTGWIFSFRIGFSGSFCCICSAGSTTGASSAAVKTTPNKTRNQRIFQSFLIEASSAKQKHPIRTRIRCRMTKYRFAWWNGMTSSLPSLPHIFGA